MKYEKRICIVGIFVLVSLLWAGATSAKDYSVTAGNWHVTFRTNETVYPYVAPTDFYDKYFINTIWINSTTWPAAISLYNYEPPVSTSKSLLESAVKALFSSTSGSPSLSGLTIDGREAIIGELMDSKLGRMRYGGMYPFDETADHLTKRFVAFGSYLDKKTSYEVMDTIHVEWVDRQATSSALNSQPDQTAPASYTPQATGTRDDPVPIGTAVDLGNGWVIPVLNVYPDATNMVLKENQFNDAPKPGDQFFLATVQVKYVGEGSSTFSSYDLRSVGPSSVGYSTFQNSAGVIPDPLPSSEVFTGGTVTGNVGWEISSSDANGLVMYYTPLIGGNSQGRMYMALYGPGSSSPATSYFGNGDWAAKGTGKMGRG